MSDPKPIEDGDEAAETLYFAKEALCALREIRWEAESLREHTTGGERTRATLALIAEKARRAIDIAERAKGGGA